MTNNSDQIEVYLLHFEPPLNRARHYIGSTTTRNMNRRMRDHTSQRGAKIVAAAIKNGCAIFQARIWTQQSRAFERRLKNNGHFEKLCPLCSPSCIDLLTQKPRRLSTPGLQSSSFEPCEWL